MSASWHVAFTQPNSERRAQQHLNNQGFRTFLPEIEKTVRHARQLRTVRSAFFPRYIFVAFDSTIQPWRCINGTRGISNLVMSDEQPAHVPDDLVNNLISMSDDSGFLNLAPLLKIGENVELISGPFATMIGQLQRIDERGRIKILLELMGTKISVWSPAEAVTAAH